MLPRRLPVAHCDVGPLAVLLQNASLALIIRGVILPNLSLRNGASVSLFGLWSEHVESGDRHAAMAALLALMGRAGEHFSNERPQCRDAGGHQDHSVLRSGPPGIRVISN